MGGEDIGDAATQAPSSGDDPTATGHAVSRPAAAAMPRTVGRYLLIEKLGMGAMGVVWAAFDPDLDRRIAIKLILDDAIGDVGRQRFIREARAMAQLHHPAIVAIHDVGTSEGHAYIAMTLVRGVTLRDWLRDETRSWKSVLQVFVRAGEGLAAAHQAGVVHRDFKPTNVMVTDDGRPVVLDFGLARAPTVEHAHHEDDAATGPLRSWTSPAVTHAAGVVGTPAYMAPEQIAGAAFDGRADQFAFCVALHEALYSVPPFPRDSLAALLDAMANGRVAAPERGRDVPARIRRALLRGLAFEPSRRWPDMPALLRELGRDPTRRVAQAASIAVGLGAVTWIVASRPEPEDPCAALAHAVDAVWSPARRTQLDAVVGEIEVGGSTVADIDHYVVRLRSATLDNCAATQSDDGDERARERTHACLETARAELDGLLEVLTVSGIAATEGVAGAVWSLPEPNACAPSDSDAASDPIASQDIRALAEADTWWRAGDATRAAALVDPLVESSAHRSASWRSRVLRVAGNVAIDQKQIDLGVRRLSEAAALALEGGDDLSFVLCAADLADYVGRHRGDLPAGRTWLELAFAAARRLGDVPLLHARLLGIRGTLAQMERHFDVALASHTEALAIADATIGREHPLRARMLGQLGAGYLLHAHFDEARPVLTEARRVLEATYGPVHPSVLRVRANLLTALIEGGRLREAEVEAQALLKISDGDGPSRIAIEGTMATLAMERGDTAAAIAATEHMLRISEREGSTLRTAAIHSQLSQLFATAGEHAAATAELEAARRVGLAAGLAPDHGYMIEFDAHAVDRALVAGRLDEAQTLLDRLAAARSIEGIAERHVRLAARLAIARGIPGDHAKALRRQLDEADLDWSDRVELWLWISDLERLAGNTPAADAAIASARTAIGDREAPLLRRELAARTQG